MIIRVEHCPVSVNCAFNCTSRASGENTYQCCLKGGSLNLAVLHRCKWPMLLSNQRPAPLGSNQLTENGLRTYHLTPCATIAHAQMAYTNQHVYSLGLWSWPNNTLLLILRVFLILVIVTCCANVSAKVLKGRLY